MGKLMLISISLVAIAIFVYNYCEAVDNHEIDTEIQEIQRRAVAQGVEFEEEERGEDELVDVVVPAVNEPVKRRRKKRAMIVKPRRRNTGVDLRRRLTIR